MENTRWPLVKGLAILYVWGLLVLCLNVWVFLPKLGIFIHAPILGQFRLGNLLTQGLLHFHYTFITFVLVSIAKFELGWVK